MHLRGSVKVHKLVSNKTSLSLFHALHQPPTCESTESTLAGIRPHSPIQLNDDVLLNVFKIYGLDIRDEEEEEEKFRFVGKWDRQRWWYNLAHVSKGWRSLIFASQVQLDLHLLCTYGVPVADMLACSPSLPLTIFYNEGDREMTEEDEEGVLVALSLSNCHRVRRIALASNLGKLITAIDKAFPVLERVCIGSRAEGSTHLVFPDTFHAPNLRHWTASIGHPLLTNTAALVNLELIDIPASSNFPPSYIPTRILLMPQLETLVVHFRSPLPNPDVEREPSNTPIAAQSLLRLHLVSFRGDSTYLEGLIARISAPILSVLDVLLSDRLVSIVSPRLLQFIQTSENLRFSAAQITFGGDVVDFMAVSDQSGWKHPPLHLRIGTLSRGLWQVMTVVQVFRTLSPMLSVVEKLALGRIGHEQLYEWHNDAARIQWRKIFRAFSGVKTLCVPSILVEELSLSLCSEGGEMPLELFPNLLELQYFGGSGIGEAFTRFINEREAAGHPVRLVRDSSPTCDGSI